MPGDVAGGAVGGIFPAMSLSLPTRGRVVAVNGSTVVFKPGTSTYELHLQTPGGYTGPVDAPINAVIRATARKVYTVPSGGGFVTPIMGTPKIVQGRVAAQNPGEIAIQSMATVNITLPTVDNGVELSQGPITDGDLVNAVLLAGATLELAK